MKEGKRRGEHLSNPNLCLPAVAGPTQPPQRLYPVPLLVGQQNSNKQYSFFNEFQRLNLFSLHIFPVKRQWQSAFLSIKLYLVSRYLQIDFCPVLNFKPIPIPCLPTSLRIQFDVFGNDKKNFVLLKTQTLNNERCTKGKPRLWGWVLLRALGQAYI